MWRHNFKDKSTHSPFFLEVKEDSVNSHLHSLCLLLQWIAKNIATNMADVIDVNRTIKIACYNNIIQSAYPRLLILCNIVFLNNSMPHSWRGWFNTDCEHTFVKVLDKHVLVWLLDLVHFSILSSSQQILIFISKLIIEFAHATIWLKYY
jgi:hypothetical protein